MSKREGEQIDSAMEKKMKAEKKDNDIAIDSELLGQQSSYDQNKSEGAAANAAAAALSGYNESKDNEEVNQRREASHHSGESAAVQAVANAAGRGNGISIQPTTLPPNKPIHGSDEWHKLRRENHKEVERRRRESINAGIKELAALIPTSDTNKAQVLQRAIEFIKRLKENETNNIEKWTLEKLLTEQAVSELDASNTKLKQELERAYREVDHWKKVAGDGK